jgi:hypothetical protein
MAGVISQTKKPSWSKRISDANLSAFVRGEKYDKHLLEATISDVVSVVIRRHFLPRHANLDISEVFSLGFCKAFMKLKEPWIDPSCDLVIIVYSTARNEIGNYLRKLRREKLVSNDSFEFLIDDESVIEEEERDVIDDLSVGYCDIVSRLKNLGISTCQIESFFPKDIENGQYREQGSQDRISRKTSYDWFSIKSAVIRTVACGDRR